MTPPFIPAPPWRDARLSVQYISFLQCVKIFLQKTDGVRWPSSDGGTGDCRGGLE
ncbi:hypothetical protein V8E53_000079, partial [Lactarius tabidus]